MIRAVRPRTCFLWAGAGAAGWYGWRWYTTPAPPDIPTDGMDPEVAALVWSAVAKVREDGRSAGAWGRLGQVLLAHEQAGRADACFAQAERLDDGPKKARAKRQEALACADRALQLNPNEFLAHLFRGQALSGLGRGKETIESYRRAVLLRPEVADAHTALGKALADDGQRDDAVAELQACNLAPNGPRPRDALARVQDGGRKPD